MLEGEQMAPYIDNWREEVRRWTSTDLVRRDPQDGDGRGRGRPDSKFDRDDTDDSGGGGGRSGGGGGGGGGAGRGDGNGNNRAAGDSGRGGGSGDGDSGGSGGRGNGGGGGGGGGGGTGRFGNDNGGGGGGGGRAKSNNNDNNDGTDRKNSNDGNDNDGGGRTNTDNNDRGGNDKGTAPPVAFAPEDSTSALPPPPETTTAVDPPPATDTPSLTEVPTPAPAKTDSPPPTDTPTTVLDPNTVVLVSTITPSAGAPVLTTFIPSMTTTALPDADPSAPRKGLTDPISPSDLSSIITGTALADTLPTTTALAASAVQGIGGIGGNGNNHNGTRNGDRNRGNGNNWDRFKNNFNKNNKHRGGLDPVAERALISVGSIGGFILICFLVWIVWRAMKKAKAKKNNGGVSPASSKHWPRPVLLDRLVAKVPFLKNRQRQWQNLDDSSVTGIKPPSYKSESGMAQAEPNMDFYAQEKTYQLPSRSQSMDPSPNAPLSTSPLQHNLPNMAFVNAPLTLDTNVVPVTYQPASAPGNPMNFTYTNSPLTLDTNIFPQYTHQPGQQSFSSTNAAQFGGLRGSTDEASTLRSRMGPNTYYNQSELARGPSDAYDPSQRQVNRVSQLSSISSGFGDGDIIMPPDSSMATAMIIKPPQPATTNLRQSTNLVGRFSLVSSSAKSSSRRDTVYTQSSEDSPPRFRNVGSWVNQQTGRVKRAQQRHGGGYRTGDAAAPPLPAVPSSQQSVGVPGIHNPPAEQSFNMMIGDDEVPRRVEDAFVSPRR